MPKSHQMILEVIPLADINPAPYNPRLNLKPGDPDYEKLKKSIMEFNMVEPLVYNKKSGNLVGGHQRLKVLQELGYTEVEVSVVNLSDTKEEALNLALNKISGDWDYPLLKDLLESLDTGIIDMEITGFDLGEIEDLMTQFHVPGEGLTDDDAIPEEVETVCKTGDLWQLGEHRLLCGDATKKEDVERLMGGEKADMVFTSPPYADLRDYNIGEFNWDKLMNGIWVCMVENTKDDAHILINLGIVYRERQVLLYWNNWMKYVNDLGHPLFGWYVWDKAFGLCGEWNGRLAPAHEFIFHFNKVSGGSARKWQESKTQYKKNHTFRQKDGTLKQATSPKKIGQPFRIPDSVIRITKETNNKTNHPAPFPVALAEFMLNTWSVNNDICYDPFGGSGSTLIACEKLGRWCYMMEIDEHYTDIIKTRWEAYTGKEAVKA